jgi:hypothetical protein
MNNDHCFEKWFDTVKLQERFYKKIRYRCTPGLDRIGVISFCKDFDEYIETINRKVLNGTYNFTNFNELLIL